MSAIKKILIIDDNEGDRELIKEYLCSDNFNYDYKFIEAGNSRSGLHYYINADPDCTILDYRLGDDSDGLGILKEFQHDNKLNSPIIFITSNGEDDVIKKALDRGAFLYFDKTDLQMALFNKAVEVSIYQDDLKNRTYKS